VGRYLEYLGHARIFPIMCRVGR